MAFIKNLIDRTKESIERAAEDAMLKKLELERQKLETESQKIYFDYVDKAEAISIKAGKDPMQAKIETLELKANYLKKATMG